MSEFPGDGEWGDIPDELEERIEARRDAEWEAKYNKPTPHALTRERVAHHASEIEHCDPEFITDHVKVLVATDAALRQALAQQAQEIEILQQAKQQWYRAAMAAEQEIENLRADLKSMTEARNSARADSNGYHAERELLKRKLAAMTAERDAFKDQCKCMYCGSHHFNISVCSKCTFTKPAAEPFKLMALEQQLAASQQKVRELEQENSLLGSALLAIRKALGLSRDSQDDLLVVIATLQATLVEREARTKELEEWQKIVIGSGTDQETVIRMAANEYTKSAVQCWKEHTKKIEAELDTARQDAARLREALEQAAGMIESEFCSHYPEPHDEANEHCYSQFIYRALKGA